MATQKMQQYDASDSRDQTREVGRDQQGEKNKVQSSGRNKQSKMKKNKKDYSKYPEQFSDRLFICSYWTLLH